MTADGSGISARIVSASDAVGTINLAPCSIDELDGEAASFEPRDDRVGRHPVVRPDFEEGL